MDFRSRDRYRHAVEELAVPTGEGQMLLALKSVERARQSHVRAPDSRESHVGHHLIGGGRPAFEASIAWLPKLGLRVRRGCFRWATAGYLGSVGAGTVALIAVAVAYAYAHGWRDVSLAIVAALAAIPASELTIQIVQRTSYISRPAVSRFGTTRCRRCATMVIVRRS